MNRGVTGRYETTSLSGETVRVFPAFKERPLLTVGRISERTGLSFPAANQAVSRLAELGIVREITGRRRERAYAYGQYVAILNEGEEE
jgi:DNA-binding Lrp family transcriptional regulator